jgi:hypothetical protein
LVLLIRKNGACVAVCPTHEEFEETNESSIVEMSLEYVNLVTARFKGASDAPEI